MTQSVYLTDTTGAAGAAVIGNVGGITTEVSVSMTVTTGSAYTAGNVVGGKLTFASAVRSQLTGVLQSVRLIFQDTQTAEFDVTFFSSNPATTFTDKTAPAISTADALLAQPTIALSNAATKLGANMTTYGADGIGRAIKLATTTLYAVVTTTGTPTFTGGTAPQLSVSILQD